MKTIGFVISHKENEKRRAIIPSDLETINNCSQLYFERGYGDTMGFSDDAFTKYGAHVVDFETVYKQDIICNPKAPEPDERSYYGHEQTFFGYVHAVQGKEVTDFLLNKKMTAIAWEEMFYRGRHIFWRNNEIAGEAAVLHAINHVGTLPYQCTAAVIGRGNTATGAVRILEKFGVDIVPYNRTTVPLLKDELDNYDIIVNAVLWDVFNKDRILTRDDLKNMKPGSMIIDISCNEGLEIETSRPTTIYDPTYKVDGIIHYVVDHTPALFWKSATKAISNEIKNYIDDLVEEKNNRIITDATIIEKGNIIDQDITKFQNR